MAEVEFRDGIKNIPDHLADMMAGLDTHKLTLTEATQIANDKFVGERFFKARQNLITAHFKEHGGGG